MSLEHLTAYARRCATEDAVGKRARAIGLTDLDAQMRYARTLGLEWTLHDMVKFRNQVFGADTDLEEVSEEELEMIAGGTHGSLAASSAAAVSVSSAAAVGGGQEPGGAAGW